MSDADPTEINWPIRRYIAGLIVLATALVIVSVARERGAPGMTQWIEAILLGVAVLVAQRFPIHLSDKTKVFTDTVFMTAAVLMLPPALAVLVGAVPTAIREAEQRVSWEQGIFNVAQTALYLVTGGLLLHSLGGTNSVPPLTELRGAGAIGLGLTTMHLLNTMSVAIVVALQLGDEPMGVWRESIWVDLPEHIALVATGGLVTWVANQYPWLLPLCVGPILVIYVSLYRSAEIRRVSRSMNEKIADISRLMGERSSLRPGPAARPSSGDSRGYRERLSAPENLGDSLHARLTAVAEAFESLSHAGAGIRPTTTELREHPTLDLARPGIADAAEYP